MAAAESQGEAIVFDGVTYGAAGKEILRGISMSIAAGERVALLGRSGAGKTTLLRAVNALTIPTGGNVRVLGRPLSDWDVLELRRHCGYVLQDGGLFPHMTCEENVRLPLRLQNLSDLAQKERARELFSMVGLELDDFGARRPRQLSGGQRQRVGVARALAVDAPVLLMDEPFGALDNVTRAKIHTEFKALDELKRKTIVMVTHDVQEAFELGDRICLMDKGKIVQIGTPAELLFRPVNHFVESFLTEQRLQLEFKTIHIKDLWNLLPHNGQGTKAAPLSADASVWIGLEKFKYGQADLLSITHKEQTRSIGFEQLVAAFYKYQSNRTHE